MQYLKTYKAAGIAVSKFSNVQEILKNAVTQEETRQINVT